jgi:type IV secretion system protein VirB6
VLTRLIVPLASLSDTSNVVFFVLVKRFIHKKIDNFAADLLGQTMALMGSIALTLLTIWIMIQGFRIVTGQSREPMMALVTNSLRALLIIGVATGAGAISSDLYTRLTDGLSGAVSRLVTGSDGDMMDRIDSSLSKMQLALLTIDAIDPGKSDALRESKNKAQLYAAVGIGGPALVGGTALMMNKIAMALFVGLGPLFIMCLLFNATKPLFQKWLYYGIGTMFSLAVLTIMVSIALDMVLAVAEAFWVGQLLHINEGISSRALQSGGLGLILSILIISSPPMAAAFFNGVMGNFNPYNQIATGGGPGAAPGAGAPPVSPYYGQAGAQASHSSGSGAASPSPPVKTDTAIVGLSNKVSGGSSGAVVDTVKQGSSFKT